MTVPERCKKTSEYGNNLSIRQNSGGRASWTRKRLSAMPELENPSDPWPDLFTGIVMRTGRYPAESTLKFGNATAAEYDEALTGPSTKIWSANRSRTPIRRAAPAARREFDLRSERLRTGARKVQVSPVNTDAPAGLAGDLFHDAQGLQALRRCRRCRGRGLELAGPEEKAASQRGHASS
jgi:hypothetical protein